MLRDQAPSSAETFHSSALKTSFTRPSVHSVRLPRLELPRTEKLENPEDLPMLSSLPLKQPRLLLPLTDKTLVEEASDLI